MARMAGFTVVASYEGRAQDEMYEYSKFANKGAYALMVRKIRVMSQMCADMQ